MLAIKILLIMVEVICSLLLVGVILLQKAKGEGLGMAFGAEMGESIFGARASNVLVKITIWIGAIFILNTVILGTLYSHASSRSLSGGRARPPVEQPVRPVPGAPLPAAPIMPAMPASQPQLPQGITPQAPATP